MRARRNSQSLTWRESPVKLTRCSSDEAFSKSRNAGASASVVMFWCNAQQDATRCNKMQQDATSCNKLQQAMCDAQHATSDEALSKPRNVNESASEAT
jgi:hypothetical protein